MTIFIYMFNLNYIYMGGVYYEKDIIKCCFGYGNDVRCDGIKSYRAGVGMG